jgi:hypothetical protein
MHTVLDTMRQQNISAKIGLILSFSLILIWGGRLPVVCDYHNSPWQPFSWDAHRYASAVLQVNTPSRGVAAKNVSGIKKFSVFGAFSFPEGADRSF